MELVLLLSVVVLWICVSVSGQNPGKELHYTIMEELPRGFFVANIFRDSKLRQKYDTSELESMRFQFLGQPVQAFTIEGDTGIIRTGEIIDRDRRCPSSLTCYTRLDVVAMDNEPMKFYEMIKVRVEITDINDNVPKFPETEITHHVLESVMPGAGYIIPTAVDPDSGKFAIQGYRLIPPSGKFRLEVKKKLDGSTDVHLVLKERLDREREEMYRVKVIAYDGGAPAKSGSIDVVVMVQDANDNHPRFDNLTYTVNIPENMPIQSTLLTVRARDRDSGHYGRVLYRLADRSKRQYGHLFGINEFTGEVFVKSVVDYERGSVYHLSVIAEDRGPDSIPSDTTVIVHVQDVNDHSPAITVNTLSATGTDEAEIAEDAAINTFVAHLTVVDKDSGRNGNFTCRLNDRHFKLEELSHGEYKIVTWAALDRELQAQYNLAITCKDYGQEPQVAIKHIQVSVTDVNDNAPVFSQESYLANLIENNNIGAFIAQVNASDRDSGHNAEVWYKLHDDSEDLFEIDPFTGVISAATIFDHEKVDYKRFRVMAIDKGIMANTGTALMIVHINDQNDASPLFSQTSYSFGIRENREVGSEVGVVAASDADGEPHNIFRFSLLPNMVTVNNFDINPRTGRITTKAILDREEQAVYYITVIATDSGIPPLSSSVTATVYIKDENDNDPMFDFPAGHNNTIYVSNKVPVGYTITKVTAHDYDIGSNGNLTYQFTRGNEEGVFHINQRTGAIKINLSMKKIDYEVYNLVVTVKDHGVPERTAIANFNIVVNKSIAFSYAESQMLTGHSLTIVIAVACGLGLVLVILVIAIIVVVRRHKKDKNTHKYNCRTEALKMLQAKEAGIIPGTGSASPGKVPVAPSGENQVVPCGDEKPKKEVSFSLNVSDMESENKPDGVGGCGSLPRHAGSAPSAHQVALAAGQGPMRGLAGQHPNPTNTPRPWTLSQKELEVHQYLGMIPQDQDADSAYSGESSNTDSGRGLSEEGDGMHRVPPDPHATGSCPTGDASSGVGEMTSGNNQGSHPIHSYSNHSQRMQTFSPQDRPSPGNPHDQTFVDHHNQINAGHHQGHDGYSGPGNQTGHYGGHQGYHTGYDPRTMPSVGGNQAYSYANPGTGTYGRTHYRMPQVPESIPENLDSPSNLNHRLRSTPLQIQTPPTRKVMA